MPNDAAATAPAYRDPLLGAKLEHVAGIVGYLFPKGHFDNKALARELAVTESRMTHKRNGNAPVDNQELCRLLVYCGLDGLTVEDLKAGGIDALDAVLRRHAIGIHGPRDGDAVRRKWLSDANRAAEAIRIQRVTGRRAGLGHPDEGASPLPHLRVGEMVRLVFKVPADGHVLLLNDEYLRRDMTCLVPSCYAPRTAVKAGNVGVPFDGPTIEPALTVLGPPGWCRLYAIWSPHEPRLPALPDGAAGKAPFAVDTHLLRDLERAVDRLREGGRTYRILTADYRVTE